MDPYFPIILTQNMILCLATACFISRSTVLSKREKLGFYLTLFVGLFIAVCEMISTGTNRKPGMVTLQSVAACLNIGLTPLLPVISVLVIGKSRKVKILALIPVVINLLFLVTGQLFTISPAGSYRRDPMFICFMGCYIFNMLLLTWRSFVFSRLNQNHNVVSLFFICLFMISSTSIQLRLPQIHFSWFCVTVTILLYLIYYADTIHKMDGLTGLLNRYAFQDYSVRCRKRIAGVLMIDLDDFKIINDSYGHLTGDVYLKRFSACIRTTFRHWGYCFRLGGDEFCVLMDRKNGGPELEDLLEELQEQCRDADGLPAPLGFSHGFQSLESATPLEDAMELADKKMYLLKASRKKNR